MTAHSVIIPDESWSIVEFRQDELPGIGAINTVLLQFEPKAVFAWHLSLMLHFDDLIENGMPSVGRPRPFEYRMDHDPDWELARWHLAEHNADA